MESSMRRSFLRRTYVILGVLIECLNDLEHPYLDAQDLKDVDISLLSLDITSDSAIDFEPRYIAPLPSEAFDRVFNSLSDPPKMNEDTLWAGMWKLDRYEEADKTACYISQYNGSIIDYHLINGLAINFRSSSFDGAYRYLRRQKDDRRTRDEGSTEWANHSLLLAASSERPNPLRIPWNVIPSSPLSIPPHAGCMLCDGNENEKGLLLRSELIAAATLMRNQMQHRKYWQHFLFPVFIYSFSGYNVRILQVHFDHQRDSLAVRMTPYMRISGEKHENTKLLLRWMYGRPIGETRFESLERRDEQQKEDGQPRTPNKRSLRCSE